MELPKPVLPGTVTNSRRRAVWARLQERRTRLRRGLLFAAAVILLAAFTLYAFAVIDSRIPGRPAPQVQMTADFHSRNENSFWLRVGKFLITLPLKIFLLAGAA